MIEAQNLRGLEDPDTHICGFMAAKWTNTSPEHSTGAINLVWAIHHFPYHLKMSFGPARRLGLGRLGSRYLNQIYWSKCRAGPKLIFEQSCWIREMITMAKPIDCPRKSDRKLKTEDGNPKFCLHTNNHCQDFWQQGELSLPRIN